MRELNYIIIHHSATPATNGSTDNEGGAIYRAICMKSRERWSTDFPFYVCDYHYLIGPTGRVFMGQPIESPSWHATNYQVNLTSIGICFLGNFEKEIMHKAQFDAGVKLVRELMSKFKVPINGVMRHRDVVSDITGRAYSTQCPGKNFPFIEFLKKLSLPFEDIDINYPYFEEISALKKKGIINGNSGEFKPKDFATREDVALMLYRLIKLIQN
jgi:N-acetyl-anhydromuramyl-L-alanine amidase AmpD